MTAHMKKVHPYGVEVDPETRDPIIWGHVFESDEYRTEALQKVLRLRFPGVPLRVLDLGAHRGYFAWRAWVSGLRSIRCVEAATENWERLRTNVEGLRTFAAIASPEDPVDVETVGSKPVAVASWDGYCTEPLLREDPRNTGSHFFYQASRMESGWAVPCYTLDSLLFDPGNPFHLVKLDIEGMEWPVLFSSRAIQRREVPALVMEVHTFADGRLDTWRPVAEASPGWPPFTQWPPGPGVLALLFERLGYATHVEFHESELSLLWAIREDVLAAISTERDLQALLYPEMRSV